MDENVDPTESLSVSLDDSSLGDDKGDDELCESSSCCLEEGEEGEEEDDGVTATERVEREVRVVEGTEGIGR